MYLMAQMREVVMEEWISRSNPVKQLILSAACAVAGLMLVAGFREFAAWGSNAGAGFLLGLLLLLIGIPGLLLSGKQTVTVDPKTKRITIEDSNRFGTKKRLIRFGEVEAVSVGYLGKRSNFVTWYYLVLKLRSGEEYPLLPPGRFYEGGSDRSVVSGWKERLQVYLDDTGRRDGPEGSASIADHPSRDLQSQFRTDRQPRL
jgi:hypothetical protein